MVVNPGAQEELQKGGVLGVVLGGRDRVGVVWEIPRLGRERALRSAERRLAGREAARHRPAARSPPPGWSLAGVSIQSFGTKCQRSSDLRGEDPSGR